MQFFISGEIIHSPPLSETDRVKTEKRLQDIYKKKKSSNQNKPTTENFKDELYQLEKRQAKGAKLCADIR